MGTKIVMNGFLTWGAHSIWHPTKISSNHMRVSMEKMWPWQTILHVRWSGLECENENFWWNGENLDKCETCSGFEKASYIFGTLDKIGCRITCEVGVIKIARGSHLVMKGKMNGIFYALESSTVTSRPNRPFVTTHRDCRLAPQTNTSLSSALRLHSCAPRKTSQEVTHSKIALHRARLTMEFLANAFPRKEDEPCWYE